ncbi:YibE/F family protein [Weissella halotolerans]|uniref:Multitransmembrane protein n=1 Tax=Weissella halotolerans DSM 20190 TaxID=1123500 RepID=A0A0R2G7W8_9LACO|nr:YibE/F family protein [Weissella halotolerans]KRN33591.1 multitransmembrane protein [Weissella halotolerans DSM 20190]
MGVTAALTIILFSLMALIGGLKGIGAFISLWLNVAVLFIMITLISLSFNVYAVLLIGASILLTITVVSTGGDEDTTSLALLTSFVVMLCLLVLIVPMGKEAMAFGFAVESSEALEGLSLGIRIPFLQLGNAAALLATLGAVAEAAVAMATGLMALHRHGQTLTNQGLIAAALDLGRQIIGTAVNTVLFGFLADFLALGILFMKLHYSLADIINAKLFTSTVLSLLYAILGVVLVLPVTVLGYKFRERSSKSTK